MKALFFLIGLCAFACHSNYRAPVQAVKSVCGDVDAGFFPPDTSIIKLLDPEGLELNADMIAKVEASVVDPDASVASPRRLPLSPKGCVAVPSHLEGASRPVFEARLPGAVASDELSVRKTDWNQSQPAGQTAFLSLALQKPLLLNFQLNCPTAGLYSSGSLKALFEVLNPPLPDSVRLRFDLGTPTDTRPRLSMQADFAQLSNAAINVAELGTGDYIFRMRADDQGGRRVLFKVDQGAKQSLQCTVHLKTEQPRQPIPTGWKKGALSVTPGQLIAFDRDADVDLLLCMKAGSADDHAACQDSDYELRTEVVPKLEGIQWFCVKARDKALNQSQPWCQELRVDGQKPQLTVQWQREELNLYAAVWRKSLGRFAATVTGLQDNQSSAAELNAHLQCRVDWISSLGAVRPSDQIICTSGRCTGQNLAEFRDCDARLEFEVKEDRPTVNHHWLSLVVKAQDAAGNATEARNQFLIGDTYAPFVTAQFIRAIAPDPKSDEQTWVATDAGVFAVNPDGITAYGSEAGLPDRSVHALLAADDAAGGLWAATAQGMAYFNGSTWTAYPYVEHPWSENPPPPDKKEFPVNHPYALAKDSQGSLLIGADEAIIRYTGKPDEPWAVLKNFGNPNLTVFALAVDGDRLWAGTNFGLFMFDGLNWTNFDTSNSILPNDQIWALLKDHRGVIWIGTSSGLVRYQNGILQMVDDTRTQLPSRAIYALAEDSQQRLLVGTEGGFARFDGTNWEVMDQRRFGLPNNNVRAFHEDAQHRLWVGTEGGGARLGGNDFVVFNRSNSGLPGDPVYALIEDAEGHIWCGTDSAIARIEDARWTVFRENNGGLPAGYMRTFLRDDSQHIWVGSDFGRIARFDGHRWNLSYEETNAAISNGVFGLAQAPDGQFLAGGLAGFAAFDGEHWSPFRKDWMSDTPGVPVDHDDMILSFYRTRSGELLAASGQNGVVRWENGLWKQLPGIAQMDSAYVLSMAEDTEGTLWAGTFGGLAKRVGDSWQFYKRGSGRRELQLPVSNTIRAVLADRRGGIWVGSLGGGLARFQQNQWTVFRPDSHGLPSTSILSLLQDRYGRIWVGTKEGLARWEPE